MTDTDKRPFMDDMRRTGVAFSVAVDDAMLAVYWDGVRDLDLTTLREAFEECRQQLKFFPRIVDLRDAEEGVRAREDMARRQRLIASAPAPTRASLTYEQQRERLATIKSIIANITMMKPHRPFRGICDCHDCQRERSTHAVRG